MMREETGYEALDDRLEELEALERTVELAPARKPSRAEAKLSGSLRKLQGMQAAFLALIIALACLLVVLIAQGQLRLPDWTLEQPPPSAEPAAPPQQPVISSGVPTPEMFEAAQAHTGLDQPTELMRAHAPADFEAMVRWSYYLGGEVRAAPVCAPDGSVYVASNGTLYALDQSGGLRWSWRPDTDGCSGAVLGPGGLVLAGARGAMVYALSQSGEVQWTFDAEGHLVGSPLPAESGVIYLKTRMPNHTGDGYIYGLDPGGRQLWRYQPPYEFDSRKLALGPDGAAYDLHHDGTLLKVNKRGRQAWQLSFGESAQGPVVTADAVVVGHRAPEGSEHYWQLSALRPADGRELWSYPLPPEIRCWPVAGDDGTLYAACYYQPPGNRALPNRHGVWALDGQGQLLWRSDFGVHANLKLLFARGGACYASIMDGSIRLGSDGDLTLGLPERDGFPLLLGPGPDGSLFAVREGELFMLQE